MSRSGFGDSDYDVSTWDMIRWRGMVTSAMRGKRGQQLLRDLLSALDAMLVKQLISGHLQTADGAVCALGAVAQYRGVPLPEVKEDAWGDDWSDATWRKLGETFDIAEVLAREIMYYNDEWFDNCTPEQRWEKMHAWVTKELAPPDRGRYGIGEEGDAWYQKAFAKWQARQPKAP